MVGTAPHLIIVCNKKMRHFTKSYIKYYVLNCLKKTFYVTIRKRKKLYKKKTIITISFIKLLFNLSRDYKKKSFVRK